VLVPRSPRDSPCTQPAAIMYAHLTPAPHSCSILQVRLLAPAMAGIHQSHPRNLPPTPPPPGEARWSHTSEDFHKDLDELADELTPQSSFKLDAEKLAGRHFGEASCRDYRWGAGRAGGGLHCLLVFVAYGDALWDLAAG
jgi:hypothetical protein